MTSIGKKIRDARKNAGMTQVELAKATNLSRSYIGDIEKDRYNPSVSTLQAIAKATNVPVETLLGGASSAPPAPQKSIEAPPAPQKSDGLPELNARDERDIQKRLKSMLDDLDPNAGLAYYNGQEPMDDETRDLIRAALENSLRVAKQIAKAKYTPKKYRKTDDTAARIGKKILDASPSAQMAVSQIIDEDKSDEPKNEK